MSQVGLALDMVD